MMTVETLQHRTKGRVRLLSPTPGVYEGRLLSWVDALKFKLHRRTHGLFVVSVDQFRCENEARQSEVARSVRLSEMPFTLRVSAPNGRVLWEFYHEAAKQTFIPAGR